jgi:5-hydroxyisourate hydrolase-like protein (transthyretin family)
VLVTVVCDETTRQDFSLMPTAPPETGSITGTVTDADTGVPIAGAEVVLATYGDILPILIAETSTNSSGSYTFSDVDAGTYIVAVRANGYEQEDAQQVTVVGGETATSDFALTPVSCDVATAISAPASVTVTKGDSTEVTVTVTGADGCKVVNDKVKATSKDTSIATVSPSRAMTDANGQATFTITGNAKGLAKVKFRESMANLKTKTTVNVTKR